MVASPNLHVVVGALHIFLSLGRQRRRLDDFQLDERQLGARLASLAQVCFILFCFVLF
jgi:hypothetical protein